MSKHQSGYTLVELVITLFMTSLVVTLVMFLTFNFWRFSATSQADQDTLTERLNAGDFLREYLGSASGLITQNSIIDVNAGKPDTAGAGTNYWEPLHAVPGQINTGSGGTITPVMYFKKYSQDGNKQLIYNGLNPYEDEYILYLDTKNNALRLRTLAHPLATNNREKTSCPDTLASGSCPADRTLITGVQSMNKRFFSRSGTLINWTDLFDPDINSYAGPDNPTVEVVELTINVAVKPVFQKSNTTSSSTVIRVAIRNV
jgi:type II secretory pathway pseudopilin PulG